MPQTTTRKKGAWDVVKPSQSTGTAAQIMPEHQASRHMAWNQRRTAGDSRPSSSTARGGKPQSRLRSRLTAMLAQNQAKPASPWPP